MMSGATQAVTFDEGLRPSLPGELPVKSECLPFSQIPHTTRLFADFLSDHSRVSQFYPRSPYFTEWFKDEPSRLRYDGQRRERVADILSRQNRSWGASPRT